MVVAVTMEGTLKNQEKVVETKVKYLSLD